MFNVSDSTTYNNMHDHLNMSKVSGWWVPRMLSLRQKEYYVKCSKEFLTLCDMGSNDIINRNATGDENYNNFNDPDSKQVSLQWHTRSGPAPNKFKVVPSDRKVMAKNFWDSVEILLIDYKSKGTTTSEAYYRLISNIVWKKKLYLKGEDNWRKGEWLL